MNTASDIVADALTKVEFHLPGAGGLRGRLTVAPGQARALADVALAALADPKAQRQALLLALPKYQRDYIASRTFIGPSGHATLIRLVRLGIEAEKCERGVA